MNAAAQCRVLEEGVGAAGRQGVPRCPVGPCWQGESLSLGGPLIVALAAASSICLLISVTVKMCMCIPFGKAVGSCPLPVGRQSPIERLFKVCPCWGSFLRGVPDCEANRRGDGRGRSMAWLEEIEYRKVTSALKSQRWICTGLHCCIVSQVQH